MRVLNNWQDLPADIGPTALALGYFDGLHLGHRAVVGAACTAARQAGLTPAVFTFTGAPGQARALQITTVPQKHALLAEMGVACCFEPPFESFKDLTPECFATGMLRDAFRARQLFCGANFGFGAGRAGNTGTLKALAAQNGMELQVLPMAQYLGQPISASRIRAALAAGEMEQAAAMLGRPYEIELPVRHGRQLGGKLGFPTLNQAIPPELQAPAFGVYITQAVVDGKAWPAATGYGTRPTVDDGAPTCETFIPGYEGDLYGKPVAVRFYKRIDSPRRFGSLQALAAAVQGWARQALVYFEAGSDAAANNTENSGK